MPENNHYRSALCFASVLTTAYVPGAPLSDSVNFCVDMDYFIPECMACMQSIILQESKISQRRTKDITEVDLKIQYTEGRKNKCYYNQQT